jgi:tellurite resistance protein
VTNRIPLSTLSISLGLAGLAELWSETGRALRWGDAIGQAFWALAAIVWVLTIVTHSIRGAGSKESFASQLKNPVQGPVAAIWPIVGMILGENLERYWSLGGRVLVIASIVASALFAAWLMTHFMNDGLKLESVHGAYFLPVAAASFVAAAVLPSIGMSGAATGAFFVGVLFWIFTFALFFSRLAFGGPFPGPLAPTIAIMAAPPVVAGAAWFGLSGSRLDAVDYWLAATTVLMLLVQLALVPRYVKLAFTLGFWSFTFPFAYAGVYGIEWLDIVKPAGWQPIVLAILASVTVLIAVIAVKSVLLVSRGRAHRRTAA